MTAGNHFRRTLPLAVLAAAFAFAPLGAQGSNTPQPPTNAQSTTHSVPAGMAAMHAQHGQSHHDAMDAFLQQLSPEALKRSATAGSGDGATTSSMGLIHEMIIAHLASMANGETLHPAPADGNTSWLGRLHNTLMEHFHGHASHQHNHQP